MTRYMSQLLLLSMVVFSNSAAVAADAATLLTSMAEKISGAEQFSVTMLIRYDTLQESGQLIEFSERRFVDWHLAPDIDLDTLRLRGQPGDVYWGAGTSWILATQNYSSPPGWKTLWRMTMSCFQYNKWINYAV